MGAHSRGWRDIRVGRRRRLVLGPYSGPASCGCRVINGDVVTPCDEHALAFGTVPAAQRAKIARD